MYVNKLSLRHGPISFKLNNDEFTHIFNFVEQSFCLFGYDRVAPEYNLCICTDTLKPGDNIKITVPEKCANKETIPSMKTERHSVTFSYLDQISCGGGAVSVSIITQEKTRLDSLAIDWEKGLLSFIIDQDFLDNSPSGYFHILIDEDFIPASPTALLKWNPMIGHLEKMWGRPHPFVIPESRPSFR